VTTYLQVLHPDLTLSRPPWDLDAFGGLLGGPRIMDLSEVCLLRCVQGADIVEGQVVVEGQEATLIIPQQR
jgi:hypothetical protein